MKRDTINLYDGSRMYGMKPLNLHFKLGNDEADLIFGIREPRTIIKRIKWWFVCRVFPFQIEDWTELK